MIGAQLLITTIGKPGLPFDPTVHSVVTAAYSRSVAVGGTLPFSATLAPGKYELWGYLDFVDTARCGGRAGTTYDEVASVVVT